MYRPRITQWWPLLVMFTFYQLFLYYHQVSQVLRGLREVFVFFSFSIFISVFYFIFFHPIYYRPTCLQHSSPLPATVHAFILIARRVHSEFSCDSCSNYFVPKIESKITAVPKELREVKHSALKPWPPLYYCIINNSTLQCTYIYWNKHRYHSGRDYKGRF